MDFALLPRLKKIGSVKKTYATQPWFLFQFDLSPPCIRRFGHITPFIFNIVKSQVSMFELPVSTPSKKMCIGELVPFSTRMNHVGAQQ